MAAGITPGESGLISIKPVDVVVGWAKENYIRQRLGDPQIEFETFKESFETEGK